MKRKLTYQEYYNMRPDEFQPGDEIAVKVILVLGYSNDYAVYTGSEIASRDHIALHGDKVPFGEKVAETLFRSAVLDRYPRP